MIVPLMGHMYCTNFHTFVDGAKIISARTNLVDLKNLLHKTGNWTYQLTDKEHILKGTCLERVFGIGASQI